MASPSDRSLATSLADRLVSPILAALDQDFIEGETVSLGARKFAAEDYDIYLPDVQLASEQFGAQVLLFERLRLGVPCIRTGEPGNVPMPIAAVPDRGTSNGLGDLLTATEIKTVGLVNLSPRDAVNAFRERLTGFLEARFSARQSNISALPGLPFTVTTRSAGLRVYYTPVYWLSRVHVLNYPSPVVMGYVQPGRFYFGAALPGLQPSFDFSACYGVPPDTQAYLAM